MPAGAQLLVQFRSQKYRFGLRLAAWGESEYALINNKHAFAATMNVFKLEILNMLLPLQQNSLMVPGGVRGLGFTVLGFRVYGGRVELEAVVGGLRI
jgi:hypothetical protein